MISNVANIQVSFGPKLNAVGSIEPSLGSWASITGESCLAHTGNGADAAGFGVNPAHDMVFHLYNEEVACFIKPDFVRFVELRFRCGASITLVALATCAGNCGDDPGFPVHFPDSVVHGVTNVQGSSWPFGDSKRAVYFCHCCRTAISGKTSFSCANDRSNCGRMNDLTK